MEYLKQNQQNNNEGAKLNRRELLAGLSALVAGLPGSTYARGVPDMDIEKTDISIKELKRAYDLYLEDYKNTLDALRNLGVDLLDIRAGATYADFRGLYDEVTKALKLNRINRELVSKLLARSEWEFEETYGKYTNQIDQLLSELQEVQALLKNDYGKILEISLQIMQFALEVNKDGLDEQDIKDIKELVSAISTMSDEEGE